jgi:hypothetical protein
MRWATSFVLGRIFLRAGMANVRDTLQTTLVTSCRVWVRGLGGTRLDGRGEGGKTQSRSSVLVSTM